MQVDSEGSKYPDYHWYSSGDIIVVDDDDTTHRVHTRVLTNNLPLYLERQVLIPKKLEEAEFGQLDGCALLWRSIDNEDRLDELREIFYPDLCHYSIHQLDPYNPLDDRCWCSFHPPKFGVKRPHRPLEAISALNSDIVERDSTVLPMILYDCCIWLSAEHLVHGFRRRDGELEKLSQDDLIRCLEGRCRTPETCGDVLNELCEGINRDGSLFPRMTNVLTSILPSKPAAICDDLRCIFRQLPTLMGVPSKKPWWK
ncbi:hypothetical protein B0H21DRAFT_756969 [Amylocystis lapponica]|nr:hypothetical protein B0H21DRAFT_756969 [Amylocystis lapponica]